MIFQVSTNFEKAGVIRGQVGWEEGKEWGGEDERWLKTQLETV